MSRTVVFNRCAASHWCALRNSQGCLITLVCLEKLSGVPRHTAVPLETIRCASSHWYALSSFSHKHYNFGHLIDTLIQSDLIKVVKQ